MNTPRFLTLPWACGTWAFGLVALTAWVAYPFTVGRSCLGAIVFIAGISLITLYYRQSKSARKRAK
jgi:hypothetical protein